MSDFVVPDRSTASIKRKVRNICRHQEHNWEGQFFDGWLFLDCMQCEAKNIQYQLSDKQLKFLNLGWNVNRLSIYVDRAGNQRTRDGEMYMGYLETKEAMENSVWLRPDLLPVEDKP